MSTIGYIYCSSVDFSTGYPLHMAVWGDSEPILREDRWTIDANYHFARYPEAKR